MRERRPPRDALELLDDITGKWLIVTCKVMSGSDFLCVTIGCAQHRSESLFHHTLVGETKNARRNTRFLGIKYHTIRCHETPTKPVTKGLVSTFAETPIR